ncbi:MAG: prolipoprotein diacylglyceryl transferase [Phycicoccus sp.]|nr:prolipoprotein diacylglyceryl transferase [Phycicoccus sp.]
MRPILFSVFGLDIQSYGASKALAALVAAFMLARAFEQRGFTRDSAYSLVMWGTIWGFVGAKVYYLLEQLPNFDVHHLGGMGFTWYGGLIGGVMASLVIVRRHQLPLGAVSGAAAVPLTIAYGIGRLGCLLSGDGTYGKPTSVPWAMTFPNGVVPTDVPVHPTPLYEALAAIVIATILWALGKRWNPPAVFSAYLALSGISRFLVEFLRINEPALFGLTQPQLWALVSLLTGVVLFVRTQFLNRPRRTAAQTANAEEVITAGSSA